MFQITEPFNMAEFGLITDQPSNSTAITAWSSSLNVRAKDGSVQGVNKFKDSFSLPSGYLTGKPLAVTQWTPAGSNHLNIAYVIKDSSNKARVFVYNTETSVTAEITDALSIATVDDTWLPQIFVFNEILIFNPVTEAPQYISADATTAGSLAALPNWATFAGNQTARIMKPFGNRLVAMNFYDDKNTSNTTDDVQHPIDFVWSSVVKDIGSLSAVEWQASTTNTAGDAFLTATPGSIVDGGQLGKYFMVYKTDAVVKVRDIGGTLVFSFESIFEDDGVLSSKCFASIGNALQFVVGNYGVYMQDGETTNKPIAKGIFQDFLYASIKPSDKNRSFVFRQTRDKEVWFCYSNKTNTGAGCNEALVYNYDTGKVHRRSLPNVLDIFESELNGTLRTYAASPDSNKILELSTTTFEADGYFTITDKPFGGTSRTKDVRTLLVESEGSVKVSLIGTYSLGETKTFSDEVTLATTDYKIDTRINGRYLNLKITMDGGTNPKLSTISLEVSTAGT